MDKKQLREVFLERLHVEMQVFKDSMLHKSKEFIFEECYKIGVYVNLYEILVEEEERMQEPVIRKLLHEKCGILDAFYEEWLSRDDNSYTELRDYVEDELNTLAVSRTSNGKEDEYGKRDDKAA